MTSARTAMRMAALRRDVHLLVSGGGKITSGSCLHANLSVDWRPSRSRARECSGASRELSRSHRRRVHPNSRSQSAPCGAVSSTRFGSAPRSCNKRASALVRPTARQTRAPWQFRWRTEEAGASNLLASTRLNPAPFGSLLGVRDVALRAMRLNTWKHVWGDAAG
jgi:hypothetical protein